MYGWKHINKNVTPKRLHAYNMILFFKFKINTYFKRICIDGLKLYKKESKDFVNTRFRVRVTVAGEARVMGWNGMWARGPRWSPASISGGKRI